MAANAWLEARNIRSRARLERALPDIFPPIVLHHALRQPLLPPTPRRAVESYWRHRPFLADRLARGLAQRSGAPAGWIWRPEDGGATARGFRAPPTPYREAAHARGPGHCCICGQAIFRFGWHRDPWGQGVPNRRATWHAACVVAWDFWNDPTGHLKLLKRAQRHRCAATGKRLLRTAQIDHREPLFRVWRDRREESWPALLGFWGRANLQVVNRDAHLTKCLGEAGDRAAHRLAAKGAYALVHSET